jgi:hypothetical protein
MNSPFTSTGNHILLPVEVQGVLGQISFAYWGEAVQTVDTLADCQQRLK